MVTIADSIVSHRRILQPYPSLFPIHLSSTHLKVARRSPRRQRLPPRSPSSKSGTIAIATAITLQAPPCPVNRRPLPLVFSFSTFPSRTKGLDIAIKW